MKKYVLIAFALLAAGSLSAQNNFTLSSPDGRLRVEVSVDGIVEYSVLHGDDVMVAPSAVSMTTAGVPSFGVDARLAGSSTRSVDETFEAPVYKRASVRDNFNELTLRFRNDYNIVFRAYDDGAAYRFEYKGKKAFKSSASRPNSPFRPQPRAFSPMFAEAGTARRATGSNGSFSTRSRTSIPVNPFRRGNPNNWHSCRCW